MNINCCHINLLKIFFFFVSLIFFAGRYDFFLVSQHVRHGTVTPTHYQIIEDTLNLQPDRIQQLTYKLTHMYYNWTVSILLKWFDYTSFNICEIIY